MSKALHLLSKLAAKDSSYTNKVKTAAAEVADNVDDTARALQIAGGVGAAGTAGALYHLGGSRALNVNATPRVLVTGGPKPYIDDASVPLDSFSAQTQANVRGLRQSGGLDVDHHPWLPEGESRAAHKLDYLLRAKDYDAHLTVGQPYDVPKASTLGKLKYRTNSDFAEGNFINPTHMYEPANLNTMAVTDNVKKYDRFFTPGDAEHAMAPAHQGRNPSIMMGNIPVSPVFQGTEFAPKDWTPQARKTATITYGGGFGAPIVFDELAGDSHLPYRDLAKRKYDVTKRFWLDDVVENLRAAHGDNFDANVLVSTPKVDGKYTKIKGRPHVDTLLNDLEQLMQTPEGQARFRGVNLIPTIPQGEVAHRFANSHYVFAVPGSTAAELMAINGANPGKVISMIPDEQYKLYPNHFSANAREVKQHLGGAAHTWDITNPDRGQALANIMAADVPTLHGRTTGYRTNYSRVKDAIVKDVKQRKIRNLKGMGIMAAGSGALALIGTMLSKRHHRNDEQAAVKSAEEEVPSDEEEVPAPHRRAVTPYLAAGIPLALGAGLGLSGSIPATRMGYRMVRQKLKNLGGTPWGKRFALDKLKPYQSHEFVEDYIGSAAGIGESVMNKPLKAGVVRLKPPGDRADEAVHWDAFTGNPVSALRRWLFEIERQAGWSGTPAKQQAIAKKVKAFMKKVESNPENIAAVKDDPKIQAMLARMHKMHGGWGRDYAVLGAANTAAYGAGMGLTGIGVGNKIMNDKEAKKVKKAKTASDEQQAQPTMDETGRIMAPPIAPDRKEQLKELMLTGAGTGAGALSIQQILKARKLTKGNNVIGVTAGRLSPPIIGSATGAGHVAPMQAILEALSNHEAVRSGEFKTDFLLRGNDGKKNTWAQSAAPEKYWGSTVETGFGGTMHTAPLNFGKLKGSPVYHNPNGQTLFLPDPVPKDSAFMLSHGHRNAGPIDRILGARQNIATFGPDDGSAHSKYHRLDRSPHAHPAIADSTIEGALKRVESGVDKPKVIQKLIELAEQHGDTRSADAMREALAKNKKIHVVSGATRGDQVAIRSLETLKELQKRNPNASQEHMILSLLSDAKGSPAESLLNNLGNDVASFGRMEHADYLNAQSLGDTHWGSPGATSRAEGMMSMTPTATSRNSNAWRDREIAALRKSGIKDPAFLAQLAKIDMEGWSPGNAAWLEQQAKTHKGIAGVSTAKDFVDFIESSSNLTRDELAERVTRYANHAKGGKSNLADRIVENARLSKKRSIRGATAANITGGVAMGLGGVALSMAGGRHHNRRKKEKEQQQQLQQAYDQYYNTPTTEGQ